MRTISQDILDRLQTVSNILKNNINNNTDLSPENYSYIGSCNVFFANVDNDDLKKQYCCTLWQAAEILEDDNYRRLLTHFRNQPTCQILLTNEVAFVTAEAASVVASLKAERSASRIAAPAA